MKLTARCFMCFHIPKRFKLLPCPLCGAQVDVSHNPGQWGYTDPVAWVECAKCGVRIPPEPLSSCTTDRGHMDCTEEALEKLAAKWNRRSLPQAPRAARDTNEI